MAIHKWFFKFKLKETEIAYEEENGTDELCLFAQRTSCFHEFLCSRILLKLRNGNGNRKQIHYEEVSLINVEGTGELRLFAHHLTEDHNTRAFSRIFQKKITEIQF